MIIVGDITTSNRKHVIFKLEGSRLHELYTYVDGECVYKVWNQSKPSNEIIQEAIASQLKMIECNLL